MFDLFGIVGAGIAASLTLTAGVISGPAISEQFLSGNQMQPCVTSGLSVGYETVYSNGEYVVDAVEITSIPAECSGSTLAASLIGEDNLPVSSETVTLASGGDITVQMPEVSMNSITHADVTVVG